MASGDWKKAEIGESVPHNDAGGGGLNPRHTNGPRRGNWYEGEKHNFILLYFIQPKKLIFPSMTSVFLKCILQHTYNWRCYFENYLKSNWG